MGILLTKNSLPTTNRERPYFIEDQKVRQSQADGELSWLVDMIRGQFSVLVIVGCSELLISEKGKKKNIFLSPVL